MEPEKKRSKITQRMLSEMEPFYVGVFVDGGSWGIRVHDLIRHGHAADTSNAWSSEHFRVNETVGQGYFGTVFHATMSSRLNEPSQEVALKRVPKAKIIEACQGQHTRPLELLQNEVLIHSSVCHRNILPFHGYFEDPENFSVVLALAPHGNVAEWMHAEERPRAAVVPMVVSSVAHAFSYLHKHRIAHRDLKPENILVLGPTHFCLGDFGWSCMGDLCRSTLAGTPEFVAPEVVDRASPYNAIHADLWALGVLTFELVYGSTPFACPECRDDNEGEEEGGEGEGGEARTVTDAIFSKILNFREPVVTPRDSAVEGFTDVLVQNFCAELMKISPVERMTADEALKHPLLQSIDDPRVDVTRTPPPSLPNPAVTTSPRTWSDRDSDCSDYRTPLRLSDGAASSTSWLA